MRSERGITLSRMATDLGVSPAYLSALEHGRRGVPTFATIQAIIGYFNVIWDDAEELQRLADLSHPRIVVDTSGLDPKATAAANRLARPPPLTSRGYSGSDRRSWRGRRHACARRPHRW